MAIRSASCLLLALLISLLPHIASAQDDLARDDGLPSRIGAPRCPNLGTGRDASLQGSLTVRGSAADAQLNLEVAVSGSGMPAARKRMKNGGSFNFNCIPKDNVMLSVYVNGIEIETLSLGNLQSQPFMNRQDVTVAYSESPSKTAAPAVVAADTLYKRSQANQRLFDDAVSEASRSNPDQAAKLLRQVVENDSADFVAWVQLGNFDFNSQHFDTAADEFQHAIALDTSYLPALLGAGRSYLALKKLDESIEVLKKAFDQKPDSAAVNQYLGEAYLQNKKGSLAIVHMKKAIEIEPVKEAPLHLRLATLYKAAGAPDLAVQECKAYLAALPNAPNKAQVEKFIDENTAKN